MEEEAQRQEGMRLASKIRASDAAEGEGAAALTAPTTTSSSKLSTSISARGGTAFEVKSGGLEEKERNKEQREAKRNKWRLEKRAEK